MMKRMNFYSQCQQGIARILLAIWLLAIGSPHSALATPEREGVIVPVTSPWALALPPDKGPAMERALQKFMSQEAPPAKERDLLRTFPGASPVSEHLPFEAREGESVRFHYQMGQWRAEVSSHIGAFSRRAVLPVVCNQGTDVASSLEALSNYPRWYSQRQIHVLDRNVCPTLGAVVYVGSLGLKGGGDGEASGSGEQEVSPPSLSRSSLDWLQEQIAARKSPEEVYPLIAERLADPEKAFSRSDQIRLLTDCVRYGRVNAEALSGKDVIVVLGNTGAGKSTFINYLAGCQLEEKRVKGHGRVVVVKDKSSGGARDEVMAIGHSASKTFMPHIAEVDGRTYCDCPGFSDNRGLEINIANAVNIKQALSRAESLRLVVLVNYYSLKADRGKGFLDLLGTLTYLLGKEALGQHKDSILLGISKCPDTENCEELWDDYMADHVPPNLSFLEERLFMFNPVSSLAGWWDRSDCLKALDMLAKVPDPSSILSVSLNDSDKNALHELGVSIEQELEAALSEEDVGTASSYFHCLEGLLVLEHEAIDQLLSSIQTRISSWLKGQESKFHRLYANHDFPGAERLLEALRKAVTSFGSSDLDISSLRAELDSAQKNYEVQQAQVSTLQGELEQKSQELQGLQIALKKAQLGNAVLDAPLWERYFGEIGVAPALPAGIEEILNSPCPFWEGKQVRDTHLLALIPSRVSGKPLTLDYLGELIKSPKGGGHGTKYDYYSDAIRKAIGNKSPGRSYWVLMTKDVLPGSRWKSYEGQCALVANHANRTGLAYEVPGALEAAVVVLLHHVRSGEFLYGRDPWRYTRCRESVNNFRVFVGGFSSGGLLVNDLYAHDYYIFYSNIGVSALRKF